MLGTTYDTSHGDTKSRRRDFSAVQEVGTEETDGDEEVEEEHEERGDNLSGVVGLGEAGSYCKRKHAGCHTSTAEHEELAATESVNREECDEARHELPGKRTTGKRARCLAVHAKTLLENNLLHG